MSLCVFRSARQAAAGKSLLTPALQLYSETQIIHTNVRTYCSPSGKTAQCYDSFLTFNLSFLASQCWIKTSGWLNSQRSVTLIQS